MRALHNVDESRRKLRISLTKLKLSEETLRKLKEETALRKEAEIRRAQELAAANSNNLQLNPNSQQVHSLKHTILLSIFFLVKRHWYFEKKNARPKKASPSQKTKSQVLKKAKKLFTNPIFLLKSD